MRTKAIAALFVLVSFAVSVTAIMIPPAACAHTAVFKRDDLDAPETAFDVASPAEQKIYFGKLKREGEFRPFAAPQNNASTTGASPYDSLGRARVDVDVYAFHLQKSEVLSLRLLIPIKDGCEDFRPNMLIAGPKIRGEKRALPTILKGLNSQIRYAPSYSPGTYTSRTEERLRPKVFDRSAGIAYYEGPAFAKRLQAGTYHVIVFQPESAEDQGSAKGEYALETGNERALPVWAALLRPYHVLRIKLGLFE